MSKLDTLRILSKTEERRNRLNKEFTVLNEHLKLLIDKLDDLEEKCDELEYNILLNLKRVEEVESLLIDKEED